MADIAAAERADAPNAAEESPPQIKPEILNIVRELRARVTESFGRLVMMLMNVPRYRHQSLGDLGQLVLEPLIRDRIAIASSQDSDEPAHTAIAGFAIWASVSEEVDARIQEQIKAGVFPTRLEPADWRSGSIHWLLDVIATDAKTTGQVLASFKQVVPDGDLRMHPHIVGLLDKDIVEKIRSSLPAKST